MSSSFSLPTLEIHIKPWVDGLGQYLDHPKNINNFVNSATRQCLEFNKSCIPQKSVLLTPVELMGWRGKGRAIRTSLLHNIYKTPCYFRCPWTNVDPQRHQVDTFCMEVKDGENMWGWYDGRSNSTAPRPHSEEPPSHILHWQAISLPKSPQIAIPEGSVLPQESSWKNDSLPK